MQVYANSPYPSLLPYLPIGLIIMLTLVSPGKRVTTAVNARTSTNIKRIVGIYVLLLLVTTASQAVLEIISFEKAMNAMAIYLLPVVYYSYFRRAASSREVRSVLSAMVVAGLIVGLYFAYDSYLKLALGQVNDYANRAFEYSIDRSEQTIENANTARISDVGRSSGLLQSHSVSGTWVAFGAFAALALVPLDRKTFRRAIILLFGIMLLLGLNFTAIVGFFIIMFLFEFGGFSSLRGQLFAMVRNFVPLALISAMLIASTLWMAGDAMSDFMLGILSVQKNLAFGTGEVDTTIIGLVQGSMENYLHHISTYPHTMLFGDGFSTFGLSKGGDVGFIESLAIFGLPTFLALVVGFCRLIKSGLGQMKVVSNAPIGGEGGIDQYRIFQFAISVTLLVLISEGHYTVWTAKSILPIVFFTVALFERHLYVPHRVLLERPGYHRI